MTTLSHNPGLLYNHRERIAAALIEKIYNDPYLEVFRKIPEADLEDLIHSILSSLCAFVAGDEREIKQACNTIGNTCFELSIPVLEAVYALFLVRDEIVAIFAAGQGEDNVDECARTAGFFDMLVIETLRRY